MNQPMLKLESFDADSAVPAGPHLAVEDAESLRSSAFEDGYGAGWTDALEQMRGEDALRRAASDEALQAVAFGFHEARDGLESCFMDLASQFLLRLLPKLRSAALRQHLEVELQALATRHFSNRLEILCAPDCVTTIAEQVRALPQLDIALVEEPSFTDAQLLIRVDQTERVIDIDHVISTLDTALNEIPQQEDTVHG